MLRCAVIATCLLCCWLPSALADERVLFDGQSLKGWEGNKSVWRVEEGVIVGGSLEGNPRNEFLTTTDRHKNFELRFQAQLEGTEGFVNGGVQFSSERVPNHHEMIGYQCDIGMGYDGALYDESRRNKLLQPAVPKEKLDTLLKKGDWNSYRIRAENGHVQLWVNGTQTVDYREEDAAIPQTGLIGLQIHGDCKAIIRFRDIVLTPLP